MAKKINTIVITGGPCAGKTTAKSWIQNAFSERGYTVLFVPEAATENMTAGITPNIFKSNLDFQLSMAYAHLAYEKVFIESAKLIDTEKILIVCDRGILDDKAYMSSEDFNQRGEKLGTSQTDMFGRYDAVFHLVTAANGAEEAYSLANNRARTETLEEARELDEKTIHAWVGHPHFRIIDNSTNFKDKMHRLIAEIAAFLGEPKPYEIERKFLIEMPDLQKLENDPNCQKVNIIQTYLKSDQDEEMRIRQRGDENGNFIFYLTQKVRVSKMVREEIERRLTKEEYLTLLMTADTNKHQIRKDRYCIRYGTEYLELDVFPFDKERAIVEIELLDEKQEVTLPDWMKVIKEVTGNSYYDNSTLAIMQKF